VIEASYVNSQDQVADIFTKALPLPKFQYLREKLGMIDVTGVNVKKMYLITVSSLLS
jgi:hypothetical protein